MTNKIAIYKNAITNNGITDVKEFMTWMLKGWNHENEFDNMSIDEMIATDIEMNGLEAGYDMSEQDVIDIVDVHAEMFLEQ